MPFLQDIVGQAENNIKTTVTSQVNSVKNAGNIFQNNLQNTVANTASNVVSGGLKAVSGAAASAFSAAIQGNLSGVVSSLNPANIASSALSGLGSFGSSSLSLSDPGNVASMSGSGGVNPGDALNGALARPDPLLSFLWYCQLPVIGPAAGSQGTPAAGVTSTGNALSSFVSGILGSSPLAGPLGGALNSATSSQLPWYYIEEATVPFRQIQEVSIFRDGRRRHYPSTYSVGNLRLGIYADSGNTSIQYLQAWNNTIIRPFSSSALDLGGGWGRASGYKLPIYIYLLDITKSVLMIIQYTECWPQTMADYNMISNASERIINHVDFSVGDCFINLMNVPADLTQALVSGIGQAASNVLSNGISSGISVLNSGLSSASNAITSLF